MVAEQHNSQMHDTDDIDTVDIDVSDLPVSNIPEDADDETALAYILQHPQLVGSNHPMGIKIAQLIALPLYDMDKMLVRVRFDSDANLQIMIENCDGSIIDVDDCSQVSYAVSAILDVEDPIDKRYRLEISSSGIDRPLTRNHDFLRHVGHEIKMELLDAMPIGEHHKRRLNGLLENVKDGNLTINHQQQSHIIPISALKMAKLVLNDTLLQQHQK